MLPNIITRKWFVTPLGVIKHVSLHPHVSVGMGRQEDKFTLLNRLANGLQRVFSCPFSGPIQQSTHAIMNETQNSSMLSLIFFMRQNL